MLTLIENGEVYAPEPIGMRSILIADDRILQVGKVDRRAVESVGVDVDVIDAAGCVVVPGFIDPHAHIIGGSGEKGYKSRTPAFGITEIVRYGITTIVGTLGADTTTRTMEGLLAQAKLLEEEGMTAYESSGSHRIGSALLMAPGLGLIQDVIIDQHFAERGRIGRLLGAIAQNPRTLGIGIDEDTAIIIERNRFQVLGKGAVYVLDGRSVTHSNIATEDRDRTMSIVDVKLHLQANGDEFDLKERRAAQFPAEEALRMEEAEAAVEPGV